MNLLDRVEPGDLVLHPFGKAHEAIVAKLPHATHVESGIGYEDYPISPWRIYESNTWMHWHLGRHDGHPLTSKLGSFVCPNYFNPDDWPLGPEKRDPVIAYLARRDGSKGLWVWKDIVKEIYRQDPGTAIRFAIAGQGENGEAWKWVWNELGPARKLVLDCGVLAGHDRAGFLGSAMALLCPTQFTEPFGGACVEALLCGTPVLSSCWGVYTERHDNGVVLCRTLSDYVGAIISFDESESFFVESGATKLDEQVRIREEAINHWGYETVQQCYADTFQTIIAMDRDGWRAGLPTGP